MNAMSSRCERAIALIDAANSQDPNRERIDGVEVPKELLYSRRMTEMLERFEPDASEAMKIAVRGQHIERWKTPRNSYSMDRAGYLQWRTGLYKYHADTVGGLMKEAGYDDAMIERVKAVVGRKGLKVNAETQLLEDVSDLTFIEHYMAYFAGQHPEYSEEKWINIVRKTWVKMSEKAHAFAVGGKLRLPEALVPLILKSIEGAAEAAAS